MKKEIVVDSKEAKIRRGKIRELMPQVLEQLEELSKKVGLTKSPYKEPLQRALTGIWSPRNNLTSKSYIKWSSMALHVAVQVFLGQHKPKKHLDGNISPRNTWTAT